MRASWLRTLNTTVWALATVSACTLSTPARAGSREQAIRLFDRLAGIPISLKDPRLEQMQLLIARGQLQEAAAIATADDSFYNVTVRHLATPLSSRYEDHLVPLNDFIATFIGTVRDDLDARQLLTGSVIYKADSSITGTVNNQDLHSDFNVYRNNNHYQFLDDNFINLRRKLVQAPQKAYGSTSSNPVPSPIPLTDTAGLLTTRAWAEAHFDAGTNRRAVAFAFQEFLCAKMESLMDSSPPDTRVARDVDRQPGGNVGAYITQCRGCHAGMDSLRGAFAYFNFRTEGNGAGKGRFLVFTDGAVQAKMNQNAAVYPDGHRTIDNHWLNNWNRNHNEALGWKEPQSGSGVNSLGALLANSQAFSSCMAKRAFAETCKRQPLATEATLINELSDFFQSNQYNLRKLLAKAATLPACLGE